MCPALVASVSHRTGHLRKLLALSEPSHRPRGMHKAMSLCEPHCLGATSPCCPCTVFCAVSSRPQGRQGPASSPGIPSPDASRAPFQKGVSRRLVFPKHVGISKVRFLGTALSWSAASFFLCCPLVASFLLKSRNVATALSVVHTDLLEVAGQSSQRPGSTSACQRGLFLSGSHLCPPAQRHPRTLTAVLPHPPQALSPHPAGLGWSLCGLRGSGSKATATTRPSEPGPASGQSQQEGCECRQADASCPKPCSLQPGKEAPLTAHLVCRTPLGPWTSVSAMGDEATGQVPRGVLCLCMLYVCLIDLAFTVTGPVVSRGAQCLQDPMSEVVLLTQARKAP